MNMTVVKKQDSKNYIKNAVVAAQNEYGLTASDISSILCELLAESREMELTQMLQEVFGKRGRPNGQEDGD